MERSKDWLDQAISDFEHASGEAERMVENAEKIINFCKDILS